MFSEDNTVIRSVLFIPLDLYRLESLHTNNQQTEKMQRGKSPS